MYLFDTHSPVTTTVITRTKYSIYWVKLFKNLRSTTMFPYSTETKINWSPNIMWKILLFSLFYCTVFDLTEHWKVWLTSSIWNRTQSTWFLAMNVSFSSLILPAGYLFITPKHFLFLTVPEYKKCLFSLTSYYLLFIK